MQRRSIHDVEEAPLLALGPLSEGETLRALYKLFHEAKLVSK